MVRSGVAAVTCIAVTISAVVATVVAIAVGVVGFAGGRGSVVRVERTVVESVVIVKQDVVVVVVVVDVAFITVTAVVVVVVVTVVVAVAVVIVSVTGQSVAAVGVVLRVGVRFSRIVFGGVVGRHAAVASGW